jgi:hypothetical protein
MRLEGEERREFQRLRIEPPIAATLGATAVTILEVGVLGARVRHERALPDEYSELRFTDGENSIALRCEVVRTFPAAEGATGNESGLRFLSAINDSGDKLRELLARLVRREFALRRRVPTVSLPNDVVDGDRTVRGRDAKFLCYRLEGTVWRKRRVFLPEQPAMGFTVATSVDGDDVHRLCQIYQASDEEGRRLIRLFAELSVSDVLQIPPPM